MYAKMASVASALAFTAKAADLHVVQRVEVREAVSQPCAPFRQHTLISKLTTSATGRPGVGGGG